MTPHATRSRAAKADAARDVLDYLEIPLRHPWHVCVPFLLLVLLAAAACALLPKKYRSSTLILVESEKVPEAFVAKMATEQVTKRLQTIKQEILSRTRLETVIRELAPYDDVARQPVTVIVERMRAAIEITVRGNDAFTIDFFHRDPQIAQSVANRLASLFIEEVARGREQQVKGAYSFIENELVEARQQLEQREQALRRYKEQHMGTLPEQTAANLSTLQRLQAEQQSVTDSLRAAVERVSLLESNPSRAAKADPATDLTQLHAQLQALRSRYTDEHPDVRALTARIAMLEQGQREGGQRREADAAAAAARAEIEQAKGELEKLKARREEIEQRITLFQARVEMSPRTEQEIATLSRDFQKLNENYLALLNKKLDAEMAAKLEQRWKGDQFRILDPANLPERHVSPNRPLILTVGVVFGLLLGLGAAVAADFLDQSVRSAQELESLLPYPVLGVIPSLEPRGPLGRLLVRLPFVRPGGRTYQPFARQAPEIERIGELPR
jgi:succinoglycan biosynthesis transport protein ExoP